MISSVYRTSIFPKISFGAVALPATKLKAVGFGLYLHDRQDDGTYGNKGLSLATEEGAHCDGNAQLWPITILAE